jgi:hypothetical protein
VSALRISRTEVRGQRSEVSKNSSVAYADLDL